MKLPFRATAAIALLLLVSGCATVPTGPTVMALPGTGKSFDQFRADDHECRQYAHYQISSGPQNQVDPAVRNAAIGTAIGALAGAAMGGHQGAGVGAGAGLLFGSLSGSEATRGASYGSQRNYDNAYVQCMYAKGQQVPVSGGMTTRSTVQSRPQAQHAEPAASSSGFYPPPPPPPSTVR